MKKNVHYIRRTENWKKRTDTEKWEISYKQTVTCLSVTLILLTVNERIEKKVKRAQPYLNLQFPTYARIYKNYSA